jgi:tRNA(Arg) A34 adenosine deaminase TadA
MKLLQGLFDQHRDLSFFILRKRIFTNYQLPERDRTAGVEPPWAEFLDRGVRVGDEGSLLAAIDVPQVQTCLTLNSFALNSSQSNKDLLSALSELEAQIPRGQDPLHDQPRKIAAILYDKVSGRILSSGVHRGWLNKTLHAEVNVIQMVARAEKDFDFSKCALAVSVKPCRMCAGLLFDLGVQVFYRDEDRIKATRTALDGSALIQKIEDRAF